MAGRKSYPTIYLALGVVLAGLLTAGFHRFFGATGFLMAAPLWGALLALPILDSFGAGARALRWLSWIDVDGRYYAHRARWVDVVEDTGGQRFIRLDHVRQFLPGLPADATFIHLYTDRTLTHGRLAHAYLRDDAVLEYLAKASSDDAIKLRQWVDREVLRPGKKRREYEGR